MTWIAQRLVEAAQFLIMLGCAWVLFALGWAAANWADPGLHTLMGLIR